MIKTPAIRKRRIAASKFKPPRRISARARELFQVLGMDFKSLHGAGLVKLATRGTADANSADRCHGASEMPIGIFIAAFFVCVIIVFSRGRLSHRADCGRKRA